MNFDWIVWGSVWFGSIHFFYLRVLGLHICRLRNSTELLNIAVQLVCCRLGDFQSKLQLVCVVLTG